MAKTVINVGAVVGLSSTIASSKNIVKNVKSSFYATRCQVDGRVANRNNIGNRLASVSAQLSNIENRIFNIQNTVERGANSYQRTDRIVAGWTSIATQEVIGLGGRRSDPGSINFQETGRTVLDEFKKQLGDSYEGFDDVALWIQNNYDKLSKSEQALIDAILKTAIDKDVYSTLKIINKIISGKADWKTVVDACSTGISIAGKNSIYVKAVTKTVKNFSRYRNIIDGLEKKITTSITDGDYLAALKYTVKSVVKVPLGGSVDIACQLIASTSFPGTNVNINSMVGGVKAVTGVDVGLMFNAVTKKVNSFWDKLFG